MSEPPRRPHQPPPEPGANEVRFEELPLHPSLHAGAKEMGYLAATPIQSLAIPEAVLGRDLVATAQTGTGKTAAFLLPILERTLDLPPGRIYALVLTPTRELALQAEEFLRKLGRHTHRRGVAVYGGVGLEPQIQAVRGGVEIVVATPGRLLDLMERGHLDWKDLKILVLDEADRMLDMGFLPDVRRVLRALPRERQTMLFSATMPPAVVELAREFLRSPKMVHVDPTTVAAVGVTHLALPVPGQLKGELLRELLLDQTMTSVLVFARTKHRANRLAQQLSRWSISSAVIHGNRSQNQRVLALEGFRGGSHRVLVATDIAARGLDVEGVSHVVNFDVPHEPEVYIHRVGRTARAQRRGDAFSLVSPEEEGDFTRIERLLGFGIPRARIPGFDYNARPMPSAGPGDGGGGRRDRGGGRRGRGGPPRRPPPRSGGPPGRRDGGRHPGRSHPRY
ncbi:MAG TPA: DEAD/DEAH box helicase [Thermoplasmata archaeon]|nr:DEAD/DEAH box helicase [Thermoplasmata archaeon]